MTELPTESDQPSKPKIGPIKGFLIGMVKVYQWVISPFLGSNCRFYPTCSQYCIEAMETHGVLDA